MKGVLVARKHGQRGFAILETLVGLAVLGSAGLALLSGLAVGLKASMVAEERAVAENLVRSQIEYVQNHAYQPSAAQYPANPNLELGGNWEVPPSAVNFVHGIEDGLQKVTVTARHNGRNILSITVYKANT